MAVEVSPLQAGDSAPPDSRPTETSLIDREKVCPACHRLLPTGGLSSTATAAHLLPPFEHRAAISARRGSAGGAASKAEWQRLRARLDESHARQSQLSIHEEGGKEGEGEAEAANGREEDGAKHTSGHAEEEMSPEEMSPAELKEALARVLSDVEALSSRHEALLANQLDLENSLKIARSNLTLAEANSEMLEEALRRGGNGFAGRMAPPNRPATPSSEAAGTGTGASKTSALSPPKTLIKPFTAPSDQPATPEHGRPAIARRRSGSEGGAMAVPSPIKAGARPVPLERSNTMGGASAPTSSTSPSAIGGFWRRSLDKRPQLNINLSNLATDIGNAIPSPSAEARQSFFANLGMTLDGAAASAPNLGAGMPIERPATPKPSAEAGASATSAAQFELYRLRQTLQQTQSKLATLSEELTATKKAKSTVEAELETLSQELFEEANKMVADERKLRATVEAEAAELKDERDALKRTMQLIESESRRQSDEAGRGGEAQAQPQTQTDLLPEEPMSGKIAAEPNVWGDNDEVGRDEETKVHTPMPADNDLEALMKRMEADFGKL